MSPCEYVASTNHSDDVTEVFHGRATAMVLCGYHASPEWLHTALNWVVRNPVLGPPKPIFGLWHGGSGYGHSYLDRDLEVFTSREDAEDCMSGRITRGHWQPQTFTFADGRREDALTPTVERSYLDLFYGDPRGMCCPVPDLRLYQGEDDEITEQDPDKEQDA